MSEVGLAAAVLQRAIDDIRDYKRDYLSGRYNVKKSVNETDDAWARRKADNDRNAAEAKINHDSSVNWMKSTQRDYLFSFESCCFLLDLSAESVREKVLGVSRKTLMEKRKWLSLNDEITLFSLDNPTESVSAIARLFKVRFDRAKKNLCKTHALLKSGQNRRYML